MENVFQLQRYYGRCCVNTIIMDVIQPEIQQLYSGSNTTFLSVLTKHFPFSFKRKQKCMLLTCMFLYANTQIGEYPASKDS